MENSKTIENGNEKLWAKIPYDVFINHIIPYTYQKIDSNLLNDIQNFLRDYRIILNYYSFDMNPGFLIHDILLFCSNGEMQFNILNDSFIDFLNRNLMFKKLTLYKKTEYIKRNYCLNLASNVEQKNKFLFSLFTPNERARFINTYIIETNE